MCHNTEDCRVESASVRDSSFVDKYKMLIKNVDFPMFDRTVSPNSKKLV